LKRRALIIYCDHTTSGELPGPPHDFESYNTYLQSKVGGEWRAGEILGLRNPHVAEVKYAVKTFMSRADYTFTIFTGHGYINEENKTCLEVMDGEVMIKDLKPIDVTRQTIIVDACREKIIPATVQAEDRFFTKAFESSLGIGATRHLFDSLTLNAPGGLSILYAASENQSAADTEGGAAYLLSLLKVAENWRDANFSDMSLSIKQAHLLAIDYLEENFEETIQTPKMLLDKRTTYFPFAVKNVALNG